ncbi:hypothetical protein ACFL17_07040 [Pseudomonadota bacterium]
MPWAIYRDDPNWVPHLIIERKQTLNKAKNPFFQHADMQLFLATKNAQIVGRIAAIRNDAHNEYHGDKAGFYGFFECINDQEVANQLLSATRDWLAKQGLDTMLGPASPSSNYEWGMLISGFNKLPGFLMPYNPDYYPSLVENYGMRKAQDFFAYRLHSSALLAEKALGRRLEVIRKRFRINLRPLDIRNFGDELKKYQQIYNLAWAHNWGFVPLGDEEIDRIGKELKPLIDPDLVIFAEIEGETIGAALAMPDLNPVIQKMNGKLFPFGLLRLLSGRKKMDAGRILTLGVVPKFHGKGVDALLYYEVAKTGNEKGIDVGEASWILEGNKMMNRGVELMKGELSKSYRIYESSIEPSGR